MPTLLSRTIKYARAHVVISSIAVVVVFGGGYFIYSKFLKPAAPAHYLLGTVTRSTVISTVTGSGQVSASNQVDIKPKANGEITGISVKEGQFVSAGQALAYIDSTSAQKAVRDAQSSLDSAKLALQKLQQPADALSLTQSQNALTRAQESEQNAKDALAKAYDDGFTDVGNAFTDLPNVMTGLNTIIFGYDPSLGGSNQWNIDFYAGKINAVRGDSSGSALASDVKSKYYTARDSYTKAFDAYRASSRASDTATIASVLQSSSDTASVVSDALKAMNNLIRVYEDTLVNATAPAVVATQLTNINNYTSTTNGHLSTLNSALSTIKNSKQTIADDEGTIAENQQSLKKLQNGADPLDVQSSQLSVTQRQNALADAQESLGDYVIRAPFSGTLAKFALHKGDTVSSGTAAATIITSQQIAELALNEVDAAKVKVGQKTTLTFDAIDGLTIAGEIASIDSIGTVTQGVVTYDVKIGFDSEDARIKPSMTVNATIQTAVHQDVLTVPASAIKSQGGASTVQAFTPAIPDAEVQSAGTQGVVSATPPQSIPVTIGISDDTNTEVLSGLTEGQQIVLRTVAAQATAAAATTRTTAAPRGGIGGGGALRGL